MLHWLVVGHVDPVDPVDSSGLPHKPKVSRPIPKDVADRALDKFGRDIDEYLSYDDGGYVVCGWAQAPHRLWGRVREFAYFLADREGAVVMDEQYIVSWPPAARQAQRATWGDRAG